MIKLYAGLAVLAVLVGLWWHYDSVISERDSLKTQLTDSQAALKNKDAVLESERADALSANARAITTQLEKKAIEDEANLMRSCISNESCGVRVKFKFNTCPNIQNATTSGPGADGATESDTRDFQTWVFDTEESIKLNLHQIAKLQQDVLERSKQGACKP